MAFSDLHEIGEMFARLSVFDRFRKGGGWGHFYGGMYLPSQRERKEREARERVARWEKRRAYVRGRDRKRELRAAARREAVEQGTPLRELKARRVCVRV